MICKLLTQILKEANVGDVYLAELQCARTRDYEWFILVSPDHSAFWPRFKSRYPKWREIARRYGASRFSIGNSGWCPEFPRVEDLLNWLADTLELPRGVRGLLILSANHGVRC